MTDFYPSVEHEFDAGHDRIDGLSTCQYDGHGHRWRVRVTVKSALDPRTGLSYRVDELDDSLMTVIHELQGKHLGKMMPGAAPTPEGLAVWIMERLIAAHPKIVEVVVWLDPQHRFSARRELR